MLRRRCSITNLGFFTGNRVYTLPLWFLCALILLPLAQWVHFPGLPQDNTLIWLTVSEKNASLKHLECQVEVQSLLLPEERLKHNSCPMKFKGCDMFDTFKAFSDLSMIHSSFCNLWLKCNRYYVHVGWDHLKIMQEKKSRVKLCKVFHFTSKFSISRQERCSQHWNSPWVQLPNKSL